MMKRLIGVGVGPGDPELVTVKAVRVLREADVVLVPVLVGPDPGATENLAIWGVWGIWGIWGIWARPGRDDRPCLRRRGPGQAAGLRAERHRRRHATAGRGLADGRRRGGRGIRRGGRHDRVRHSRRPQPVLHVQLPGPDRPRPGPRGHGGDCRGHHRHAGPSLPSRHLAGRGHRTSHARPAQRRRQRPGPGAGRRRNRRRLQGRCRRQPRARHPAGPPARGRPPGRRRHRCPPRPRRRAHRPRRRGPAPREGPAPRGGPAPRRGPHPARPAPPRPAPRRGRPRHGQPGHKRHSGYSVFVYPYRPRPPPIRHRRRPPPRHPRARQQQRWNIDVAGATSMEHRCRYVRGHHGRAGVRSWEPGLGRRTC